MAAFDPCFENTSQVREALSWSVCRGCDAARGRTSLEIARPMPLRTSAQSLYDGRERSLLFTFGDPRLVMQGRRRIMRCTCMSADTTHPIGEGTGLAARGTFGIPRPPQTVKPRVCSPTSGSCRERERPSARPGAAVAFSLPSSQSTLLSRLGSCGGVRTERQSRCFFLKLRSSGSFRLQVLYRVKSVISYTPFSYQNFFVVPLFADC